MATIIQDTRTTLGVTTDDRSTLGIVRTVGRPRNILLILQSILSEEFFGTISVYQEEDQTLSFGSITSEEAFGRFWFYKYDGWHTVRDDSGGGGALLPSDYDKIKSEFNKRKYNKKQTIEFGSIASDEKTGKINIDLSIDFHSIKGRDNNSIYKISVIKSKLDEEESLILAILLSS
jgi:hypothetical protein